MLMLRTYREVLPRVRKHLELWQQQAETIPNSELGKQALLSIESKAFHCEGGAIYGLLAQAKIEPTIRFIIAYQTICDYLDNLCDRSTLLDPRDFRTLHQACIHALTPAADCINYYQFRQEQDDGGYLIKLVQTCQDVLIQLPSYRIVAPHLYELAIKVKNSYLPWVQGLHILLDYSIDREEDSIGGDLNFCNYYNSEQ